VRLSPARAPLSAPPSARDQFLATLRSIVGDARIIWLPKTGDGVTVAEQSPQRQALTFNAAPSIAALGTKDGAAVTFDGAATRATIPDSNLNSFGNGTTDSPFSVIALGNFTNNGAQKTIAAKFQSAPGREWDWYLNTTAILTLRLGDASAAVFPSSGLNVAVSLGVPVLVGSTYTAATGGATAGNDIIHYVNGATGAATASNNASYVAMENGTSPIEIGSDLNGSASLWMAGTLSLFILVAGALSADQHMRVKNAVNSYFGLTL